MRGHRHGQGSLQEILEGFLEKEALGVRGELSQCREAHLNNSNDINMIIIAGDIY